MADWFRWQSEYDRLTIRTDGDSAETLGAQRYDLDRQFPNYELFWRYHIAPATGRPASIYQRPGVAKAINLLSQASHGVFCNLVDAADALAKVRVGDWGGDRFRNCLDCIGNCGDAIQKVTNVKSAVDREISSALRRRIIVWTNSDWESYWSPPRKRLISYRNHITHQGSPLIKLVSKSNGTCPPSVLGIDNFDLDSTLSWQEQSDEYDKHPERWEELPTVCEQVFSKTIFWVNDVYGAIRRALDPFLNDPNYQNLWAWDPTNGPGKSPVKVGLHFSMSSASAVVSPPNSGQMNV